MTGTGYISDVWTNSGHRTRRMLYVENTTWYWFSCKDTQLVRLDSFVKLNCAVMERIVIGAEASPVPPSATRGHCVLQDVPVVNPRTLFCYNWVMQHQVGVFSRWPLSAGWVDVYIKCSQHNILPDNTDSNGKNFLFIPAGTNYLSK